MCASDEFTVKLAGKAAGVRAGQISPALKRGWAGLLLLACRAGPNIKMYI